MEIENLPPKLKVYKIRRFFCPYTPLLQEYEGALSDLPACLYFSLSRTPLHNQSDSSHVQNHHYL